MFAKIFEKGALASGGAALSVSVALAYEGGHSRLTCIAWAVGGLVLLVAGTTTWATNRHREHEADDQQPAERREIQNPEKGPRVGIDNSGDMEIEDVVLGRDLDTGIRNRPSGRFRGRRVTAD